MNWASFIAAIAIVAAVFLAALYIIKEKKKGNRCIGCPYSDDCKAKHNAFRSHPTKF